MKGFPKRNFCPVTGCLAAGSPDCDAVVAERHLPLAAASPGGQGDGGLLMMALSSCAVKLGRGMRSRDRA